MKKKLKDKSKEFLFIKLDKQDLIDIYTLLHKQFQIAEASKGDTYWGNRFSFEIDDYEIESIEDIQKFKENFQGRLIISLRTYDDIELSLNSYSSASGLSLSWAPNNPASGGLASEISEVLDRKKRKWAQCFFSNASASFLTVVLTILFFIFYAKEDIEYIIYSFVGLVISLYMIISGFFYFLSRKYLLDIDFRSKNLSIFKTHSSEIKVGLVVAAVTWFLTVVAPYLIKVFNP